MLRAMRNDLAWCSFLYYQGSQHKIQSLRACKSQQNHAVCHAYLKPVHGTLAVGIVVSTNLMKYWLSHTPFLSWLATPFQRHAVYLWLSYQVHQSNAMKTHVTHLPCTQSSLRRLCNLVWVDLIVASQMFRAVLRLGEIELLCEIMMPAARQCSPLSSRWDWSWQTSSQEKL